MSIITKLEQDTDSEENLNEYEKTKKELEKIYDTLAESVHIRGKFTLYQYGEKSTKYFYGLEKKNALCGKIKTLLEDVEDIWKLA